jgi:hypothetical protein
MILIRFPKKRAWFTRLVQKGTELYKSIMMNSWNHGTKGTKLYLDILNQPWHRVLFIKKSSKLPESRLPDIGYFLLKSSVIWSKTSRVVKKAAWFDQKPAGLLSQFGMISHSDGTISHYGGLPHGITSPRDGKLIPNLGWSPTLMGNIPISR